MGKLPLASVAAVAISSLYCIDGFSFSRSLLLSQRIRSGCALLASKSSFHDDTNDECCPMCLESNSCCSNDGHSNRSQHLSHNKQFNSIFHISRRKFVQFAAASSAAACSSAAYGENYSPYTSSVSINNDIIAYQTGPLAPFSSTRQYRTIVLSNG